MRFVIIRRTKRRFGKSVVYTECKLSPDGVFDMHSINAVTFPNMKEAEFVASRFPMYDDVEYVVRPYEHPEVD